MSYRRRYQETSKPISTTIERQQPIGNPQNLPPDDDWNWDSSSSSSSVSLAAKAIRASSAHRDSSLSSAYVTGCGVRGGRGDSPSTNSSSTSTSSSYTSRYSNSNPTSFSPLSPSAPYSSKDSKSYEYKSMKNLNEPSPSEAKNGFWGVLARKAKAFLDDDNDSQQFDSPERPTVRTNASGTTRGQDFAPDHLHEIHQKGDGPSLQKKFSSITSSINHIGGTIGNALEEGLTVVENRTANIIQETRKHIKKNPGQSGQAQKWQPQIQTDIDLQLKASRDVAMAMAAKAKLLLRELKTVKADLAFAKERCAQLEEVNKSLHENHGRGDNPEDDDLIRLQLESLLAEKARLAHENSIYARENRFLREVVEYHQLTMQDVVYLDESTEEVTEVYPTKVISSNPLPSQDVNGVSPSSS